MPVADPVLQRNAPLPAHTMGNAFGVGGDLILGGGAGHHHGAVRRQPVRPVIERLAQCLAQQKAAKARTIDEKVALNPAAILEYERPDTLMSVRTLNIDDCAFNPLYAPALGQPSQMFAIKQRIEMIGISELAQRIIGAAHRQRKAVGARSGLGNEHVLPGGIIRLSRKAAHQPPVMQLDHGIKLAPDKAELVQIAITLSAPVVKFDPQLERAIRSEE